MLDGSYGKKEVPIFAEFQKEFITGYVEANNKPSERASKKGILKNHLLPYFGSVRLDIIGARDIEKYKACKLKDDVSAKTINNHLAVLSKLLRLAAEWHVIQGVPTIKPLKVDKEERPFLDFDEAERLKGACAGQLRVMVVTMLNTGIRIGEARALRWEDIDLKNGRLIVRRNDWYGIEGTPKGGRKREIPLNDEAVTTLKGFRHLRSPYVFPGEDGPKMVHNELVKPLWSACRRAGVQEVTWHTLRHSFASHLAMRGVSMKAIAELLGQSVTSVTERYVHLSPHVARHAVDTLLRPPDGHLTATKTLRQTLNRMSTIPQPRGAYVNSTTKGNSHG